MAEGKHADLHQEGGQPHAGGLPHVGDPPQGEGLLHAGGPLHVGGAGLLHVGVGAVQLEG